MTVVTRFAPSPTGFLHIGGARTALFNYLYARHTGGKFLLRIEDTDAARSTQVAVQAIIDGLAWLGINHDGEIVMQSERAARHQEVAHQLVEKGAAYYCYTSLEEIHAKREEFQKMGKVYQFKSPWRDNTGLTKPEGVEPVVRFKAPQEGHTEIQDVVQGKVKVDNNHIEDFILLRSDSTPTYMLAVVVDDHDMGITHIIRGDDHLNNAFKQYHIFKAMGWNIPTFAHIPLIHGTDGAKLSKRHGALGIEHYKEAGYMPEALCNYLLRLGWSHGDDEIISHDQAVSWFNLTNLGKAPARLDFDKMLHVNGHYIKNASNDHLIELIRPSLEKKYTLDAQNLKTLTLALEGLKTRAKTLNELSENVEFYLSEYHLVPTEEAMAAIKAYDKNLIDQLSKSLQALELWNEENIKNSIKAFTEKSNIKLGQLGPVIRALMTGKLASPSIFEMMSILGKEKTIERLKLMHII